MPTLPPDLVTCDVDEVRFRLHLKTDNYPQDYGYQIIDTSTTPGTIVRDVPINESNPPFPQANTLYIEALCMPFGASYRFRLLDAYGDGLCCTRGLGYFQVYMDFFNEVSEVPFFASWHESDGPLENDGVLYEFTEQEMGFSTGTQYGCRNGQLKFQLTFLSDYWVEDYSWILQDRVTFQTLDSGGNYADRDALYMDVNVS